MTDGCCAVEVRRYSETAFLIFFKTFLYSLFFVLAVKRAAKGVTLTVHGVVHGDKRDTTRCTAE